MSVVEIAVLLHYLGGYVCETAGDHVCDDSDNTISIIRNSVTTCVSNRTYILAADGDDGVVCMPTQSEIQETSEAHADIQTLTPAHDVHAYIHRTCEHKARKRD